MREAPSWMEPLQDVKVRYFLTKVTLKFDGDDM